MKWGVRKDGKPQGYQGPVSKRMPRRAKRVENRVERASGMKEAKLEYKALGDKQAYKKQKADVRRKSGQRLSGMGGGTRTAYTQSVGRYVGREIANTVGTQLVGGIAAQMGVPGSVANTGALAANQVLSTVSLVRLGREVRDIRSYRSGDSSPKQSVDKKPNKRQERKSQKKQQNTYMEAYNRAADKVNSGGSNLMSAANARIDKLVEEAGVKDATHLTGSGEKKLQQIYEDYDTQFSKLVEKEYDKIIR